MKVANSSETLPILPEREKEVKPPRSLISHSRVQSALAVNDDLRWIVLTH